MNKDQPPVKSDRGTATPVDQSPQPFEIPADGCLGLLALGYHGLDLWREVRDKQEASENAKGR